MNSDESVNGKHRCRQTQCAFFLNGGCQKCEDCKEASFVINEACGRCNACENIPDSLRWGNKHKIAQSQAVQIRIPEQNQTIPPKLIEVIR